MARTPHFVHSRWLILVPWGLIFMGTHLVAQPPAPAPAGVEIQPSTKRPPSSDSAREADEYFAMFRLLADTIDEVERNYVRPIQRREIFEAAVKGILSHLDPYSDYLPPEQYGSFRDDVENEFAGLGLRVARRRDQLSI